jgi:NAD-dependent DNA ligase
MRSLDKVKPELKTLRARICKYRGKFVVSDKLDGISALLYIPKNSKDGPRLYTRGDGTYGQDITHLLPGLVPDEVLERIPAGTAIRGELIIPEDYFKRFAEEYKNARNLVAGLANSKTMDSRRKEVLRYVHFVPYLMFHPHVKPTEQINLLKRWGFDVVWHRIVAAERMNEELLTELLHERRDESPYRIDGLVVAHDSIEAPTSSGNPEGSFAFKSMLTAEMAEAVVERVSWRVSKDGYLKPKVHIHPVELNDVTISRATAFNAKWILDNNIGPGARVKIIRSGDVIPYIVDVLSEADAPQMPHGKWRWGETGVDAIGTGSEWKRELEIARNLFFFTTIGVRGLGEGVVTKLYDAGFCTVRDILSATASKLSRVDRMGQTSGNKLRAAIDTATKHLTLERVMVASQQFGRSMGARKVRSVLKVHPDILTWRSSTAEIAKRIGEIDGFADKTATQFAAGLKIFRKWLREHQDLLPKLSAPKIKAGGKFRDKKLVLTGFRNKDLQTWIENEGGTVTGSVSKNTYMVIYVGETQSKVQKAKQLGVTMMTLDEFTKRYKWSG